MKVKPRKSIRFQKLSLGQRLVWILLLVNFINFSANFYEDPVYSSNSNLSTDPIDSISEIIYEFILDGDQDTIPDDGSSQEEKNIKKLTVFLSEIYQLNDFDLIQSDTKSFSITQQIEDAFLDPSTPPPDFLKL